ncbi:hydrolase-like protein [Coniochaeta sp. 2T2.1]|nr:hydrolase-like protein [Coniochaeta sp. 2T2.1]
MDDEGPPPASFKGRLQLQNFMFQAKAPPSTSNMTSPAKRTAGEDIPRRSPRNLTPTTLSVPASPSPSPIRSRSRSSLTPGIKRPAPDDNEDDNTIPPSLPPSTTTTPSQSPSRASPSKRPRPSSSSPLKRSSSSYAPPSLYAHLPPIPDALAPNLLVLFIGLNPGLQTSRTQHAYAHPSNLFWKLLASSGITPRFVSPAEDRSLPRLYGLGLTNIVSRPTRNGGELSRQEMDAGVEALEEKCRRWRPECVAVVGKGIWESIYRVRTGKKLGKGWRYGWQEERMGVVGEEGMREGEREVGVEYGPEEQGGKWEGSRVFVTCSTSGLAATLRPPEKEAIFRELGEWVERRREERKEEEQRRVAEEGEGIVKSEAVDEERKAGESERVAGEA